MPRLCIGDIELYYDITGKGQPTLLIHGLGSGARDWEMQVPFLSKNFQVVTVDVRGHGQSEVMDNQINPQVRTVYRSLPQILSN